MNISVVTPWPPQHTGIADYAYDLVSGLHMSGTNVSVWTDCDNPIPVDGLHIYKIDKNSLPDLSQSDLILYQMGNNTHFHLYMIELIKKYRGIVHLHDIVLHHLMAWLTWGQGDLPSYLALVEKWYGSRIRRACADLLENSVTPWDSEIVTEIPLFQEVLQYADACIIHSYFAQKKIQESFPNLNIYKIDQIYKDNDTVRQKLTESKTLRIGVFGGVDPQKRVDICIEAFTDLLKVNEDCELHIVGSVDKRCGSLHNGPKKLGIKSKVIFHHRVSDDKFYSLLSTMDLLVALRYPTMGETSAIVMRAMKKGIPVIVNRIGWYAELPGFVDKIDIKENMKTSLLDVLLRYLDHDYLHEKKEAFIKYANENLSFEKIITIYREVLNREYNRRILLEPFRKVLQVIEEMDIVQINSDNDQILRDILRKTYMLFN
jgi:glycosyltransferase involved in cell wall biosynthesis